MAGLLPGKDRGQVNGNSDRKKSWLLLAVLIVILAAILYYRLPQLKDIFITGSAQPVRQTESAQSDANSEFAFRVFPGSAAIERDMQAVSLSGIGPTALDGMNRDQFTAFRLQKIEKYRQLGFFRPGYSPFAPPHNEIWGHMTPGADWLYSVPYYIANPYLLVILVPPNHVTPIDMHVDAVNIQYQNGVLSETILGASARQWFDAVYSSRYAQAGMVRLVMVNAWDAGFRYIHLDPALSSNIQTSEHVNNVTRSWHSQRCVFHVGRYKKNNLSPEDRRGWVKLQARDVPTIFHIKLWRAQPAAVSDPADLIFIITIDPHEKHAAHTSMIIDPPGPLNEFQICLFSFLTPLVKGG